MELVHREAQYNELKNVKKIITPDLMVLAVEGGPILMQHPVVMQTAKDFRDGPYDYDYEESIKVAIDQRKHLLNCLVPEEDDDDNDESMAS